MSQPLKIKTPGIEISVEEGADGTPVVHIDTDESLDGSTGPAIRVRLNDVPIHIGRDDRLEPGPANARRELRETEGLIDPTQVVAELSKRADALSDEFGNHASLQDMGKADGLLEAAELIDPS